MPNIVQIFFSAVTAEFKSYRLELAKDFVHHCLVKYVDQESLVRIHAATIKNLDANIVASDVVLHVAGDMTGWTLKPTEVEELLRLYPDFTARVHGITEPLSAIRVKFH